MAVTQNTYTGNGSTTNYSFTFPYLDYGDIKVTLNGVTTTAYTFANATTVSFNTAPANGVAIRIYRDTDTTDLKATFFSGSAIRSQDLNNDFLQSLYATQESENEAASATSTANTALTNANAAVSTANTASTNASAAVSTANTASANATTAVNTANAATSTANSAVSTANTASSNASTAVTTANTALSTANTALSTANSAVSTANTASSNATAAVNTANTASTNASNAVTTANTASSNATSAVNTANTASTTASGAVTTANAADAKANQAIAAVANAILYTVVADVAAIPATPSNNTAIEVTDSTGIQSFTPLAGKPAGFTGSSGLSVRIVYSSAGTTWNWIQYFPNDPETRYLKLSGGTLTGALTLPGAPSSNLHAATKAYVDSADATLTTAAAAAQSTANAALPKAGGTMTGAITFAGGQTFPGAVTSVSGTAPISVTGTTTPTVSVSAGTTAAAGVVQLTDSTASTSTTTAATPNSVKSAYDLANTANTTANTANTTANAALPKAGGTMTGNITFNGAQTFPNTVVQSGSTASAAVPSGTTAQRDASPLTGYFRYNTTLSQFEGYNGTAWGGIGGGATGAGTDRWAVEHDNTITQSYTITSNKNVISAGPMTINNGVVITIPSGSTWSIV